MAEQVRTFIAIEPPEDVKGAVARLVAKLEAQGVTGVRWVGPEAVHLTLKFLGDIEASRVGEVLEAMGRAALGVEPFPLALEAPGAFPDLRAPRILWVGCTGDLERLRQLQERLEGELAGIGIPQEGRSFSPHLTLGRVRDGVPPSVRRRVGEALARMPVLEAPPWEVRSCLLMRSTLTPSGPLYSRMGEISLTSPLSREAGG